MSEQSFKSFIDLVNFDQETRSLHKQVEDLKKELQTVEEQHTQISDSLQQFEHSVRDTRKQVDEKELEMKDLDTREKEKKKKMDSVTNAREYQSFKREIETLKRMQAEGEQELMELWNKLEIAKKELENQKKEFATKDEEITQKVADHTKKIQELNEAIAIREKDRPARVAEVPKEWQEKYDMMSMQVADPIVPVTTDSCSACFYMLPGHEINRIEHNAIIQCKNCFRLLYKVDLLKKSEE